MYRKIKSVLKCYFLFLSIVMAAQDSFAVNDKTYTIAVLDLEANGVSMVEAKGLSEKIRTRISWILNTDHFKNTTVTDTYAVVERSQIDKILEQYGIQNIVCANDSCYVEFGKMLQADRIIIGSVNLIGKTYNVSARMIDVKSAKAIAVSEVDYRGSIDGLLGARIQDVADELILGCPYREWESLENISVSGNPQDAIVSINGKKIGSSPLQNKMAPVGTISVKIRKSGYEEFREKILLKKGTLYDMKYTLWPKTRKRTIIKSLYFPGSGQRYAEHKGKGYLITLAQAAAIAGVVETTLMSIEARKDYDDAKDNYYRSASQDEYNRTYSIVEDRYDDAQQAQTLEMISAGAAVAVYLYNIIDAALTVPQTGERLGQRSLKIEPKLSKGCSSIMVSMRF